MKNTAGWPRGRGVQPRRAIPTIQKESPFEDSRRLIIFVLPMYKQLTSEQRSQIFALLQRKYPRKEIARIVGISQSTLSRELRRNSTPSGKYIWFKAQRQGDGMSQAFHTQCCPCSRIGVENQTTHHRRTVVTATNIGRVEEGRHRCLTSMHLQPNPCRCKRGIGTTHAS